MKTVLMVILAPLFLSGCSTRWVKVGLNPEDFPVAYTSCWKDANTAFPVKNEIATRTVYVTHREYCRRKDRCGGEKYIDYELPEQQSYVVDVNSGSRSDQYHSCMIAKGWDQQTRWSWEWEKIPVSQQYTGSIK